MKAESKFWQLVKRKTPIIQWTRLESWSSYGVPDLLGYHENCGYFMVELKIIYGKKLHFSPHQKLFHLTRQKRTYILAQEGSPGRVNLYGSSSLPDLLADYKSTQPLASDDWDHIQRLLACEPLDS